MHSKPVEEIIEKLQTNIKTGLNNEQVQARLSTYGENKLQSKKNKPFIVKVLANFLDTMIIILCIACAISFWINIREGTGLIEPIIILVIIFLNVFLSAIQEQKAEKSLDSLKKLTSKTAKVLRGGEFVEINSKNLVVGDIVMLDEGDLIPCDMRIISSKMLKVDESTLTGESFPVLKQSEPVDKNSPLAERTNMCYGGSLVSSGNAMCVVTATGMNTELGHIAKELNSSKKQSTPLQKKISKLGIIITIISIILSLIVVVIGLIQKLAFSDVFMNSVSLAIATIPESLTAVVTFILAISVERMADKKAIVKNLPAIETLGSVSVICTDKTGTLTQNKMTVTSVCDELGNIVDINSQKAKEILAKATLCCNGSADIGDPTERAIWATKNLKYTKKFTKIDEKPFDSVSKMMTTIHKTDEGDYIVITKGAFEAVSEICSKINYNQLELRNNELASNGIRVLAVAFKKLKNITNGQVVETNMEMLGLIGITDPPREEVKEAIAICKEAKIRPMMITGDNPVTAKAIAKELNILDDNSIVLTSKQLNNLTDAELKEKIDNISIIARATPQDKLRIVKILQKKGHVVAMTGDGVNDAPALKHADIGCVMGIAGSEVAKKNSDLILTDDNFTNIVSAVSEGRNVYSNMKKVVQFLLGTNYSEAIFMIFGLLLFGVCPLISIQLLWINLVTDSFPALGLGLASNSDELMKKSPTKRNASIVNKKEALTMTFISILISALSLLGFYIGLTFGNSIEAGATIAFAIIAYSQVAHSLNLISEDSIFNHKFNQNKKFFVLNIISLLLISIILFIPPLANIFGLCMLEPIFYVFIFTCSIFPIVIMEIIKLFNSKSKSKIVTK